MAQPNFVEKPSTNAPRDIFDIDIRGLWLSIRKHRLVAGLIMAAALLSGVVITLLMVPKYQASVMVQIEQQSARVLNEQALTPEPGSQESERFLQTQIGVVRSRSIAEAVANDLRLGDDKAFLEAMNLEGPFDAAGALNGDAIKREAILRVLRDNLTVSLPPDSRLATISFLSRDPVLSAKIANSYAKNYIEANLRSKFETSAYARQFLAEQLDQAKERLERSERDALAYARQAGIIDADTNAQGQPAISGQSLTTSTLIRLNQTYADALATRLLAEQRWRQAQSAGIMALPEVIDNDAIQDMVQRKAQLEGERREARMVRTAEYPNIDRYDAEITELDRQIASLAGSIRSTLKSQYDVAARQEQAISAQLARLKGETLSERDRNVRLSILKRAADTNRGLYDALLQRYRELSAEAGIQQNTISIVDRANIPSQPVSPVLWINLAIALAAGLTLTTLYILVRESLDDRINTGADVQEKLRLPFLGAVPSTSNVAEALEDQRSEISEAYNSVRTLLRLSSTHGLPRNLLVTSAQPGEGKTTTVYALARALGRMGKSVVVVDLDMRRPALQKYFGTAFKKGAVDFLTGAAPIDDIIQPTSVERVSIVPCGPSPPNPTELLSDGTLARMIEELGHRFNVVLVDAPPTIGLADALILGGTIEATILVVMAGRNHQGNLKTAVSRLVQSGSKIVGVVLMKYNSNGLGYGADYNYSYRYEPNAEEKPVDQDVLVLKK